MKLKPWIRILIIFISALFILGGALNDGFTGWFWAIPFVWVIFFVLPYNMKWKIIITIFIVIIMIAVSHYKYYSHIVYPVIGQEVKILEDIPLIGLGDYKWYNYEWYFHPEHYKAKKIELEDFSLLFKNTVFRVVKINMSHPEFASKHAYILANSDTEFAVNNYYLEGFLGNTPEQRKTQSFCTKVDWEYCDQINFDNKNEQNLDPMRKSFRYLSNLMFYPGLPFWFYGFLTGN